jgi:hypothetical protein
MEQSRLRIFYQGWSVFGRLLGSDEYFWPMGWTGRMFLANGMERVLDSVRP